MPDTMPQERYYTSLENSMSAIRFDGKDVCLQLRHVAGGQYTQTEFIYNALSLILTKLNHIEAVVDHMRSKK